MMKFIKGLFGGISNADKVVETAASGLYNGLDKLVYTDEEKADAMAKGRETFLEFTKLAYDQNSIRSVTRRWLSFLVLAPMTLFAIGGAVAYLFNAEYSNFLFELVEHYTTPAMVVIAFYFGPHALSALKK